MESQELSCRFSLQVRRDWPSFSKNEKAFMEQLPKPYASRFLPTHGTVKIELSDHQGQRQGFHFASDLPPKSKILSWVLGKTLLLPAASKVVRALHKPLKFIDFFVDSMITLCCTMKAMTIGMKGGFIKDEFSSDRYHERLDIDITPENHAKILQDLETRSQNTTRYHLLFNNCASGALDVTRQYFGEETISRRWVESPNRLSRYFRMRAVKQQSQPRHMHFVTFEDRFKNGEINVPQPLTA